MVRAEIALWSCRQCGTRFYTEAEADKCCSKPKKDWDDVQEFELKQVHLDLLQNTFIDWEDCEYGAPSIDCKRPYGNSDVEDDIAEIIKLKKKGNWDYSEECWNEKASHFLSDLHRQTQLALQIILHCKTFRLGKYQKTDKYSQDWKFVGGVE